MALPVTHAPIQELRAELALLEASSQSGERLPYADRIAALRIADELRRRGTGIAARARGGSDVFVLRLLPDLVAALTLVAGGAALTAFASLL